MDEFLKALGYLGIGAGIAWYFTKQYMEKQLYIQMEEVREYYREAVKDLANDSEVETEEAPEEDEGDQEEDLSDRDKDYNRHLQVYGSRQVTSDYARSDVPVSSYAAPVVRKSKAIFRIPREVFYSGEDQYEKEVYLYYPGDDTITTYDHEVVTDHTNIVGSEFVDTFEKDLTNYTTWIRNEELMVDYEIYREEGSYSDEVARFPEGEDTILRFKGDD